MTGNVISYLETFLRPSVETDIVRVATYHGRRQWVDDAGHFSIPRDVFCCVDHLGYIASGDESSTARGVKFIAKYFPQRYRDRAELVWAMWRHGVVHEYKPLSYRVPLSAASAGKVEVRWVSTNHNRKKERAQQMLSFAADSEPDTVLIVSNTCQLADDLLEALDRFISDLKADPVLCRECSERVAVLSAVRNYTDVKGKSKDRVKNEVARAWTSKGGLLDKKGNVAKRHPASGSSK